MLDHEEKFLFKEEILHLADALNDPGSLDNVEDLLTDVITSPRFDSATSIPPIGRGFAPDRRQNASPRRLFGSVHSAPVRLRWRWPQPIDSGTPARVPRPLSPHQSDI